VTPTEAVEVVEALLDPERDTFAKEAAPHVLEALRFLCTYARSAGLVACVHKDCTEKAKFRVHWPGAVPPPVMCERHRDAAVAVARTMEFPLHVEGLW
jgi:hypothetical protein